MNEVSALAWSIVTVTATATVFTVVFAIGLALDAAELRWAIRRPWLIARGLFAVFIVVPVAAVVVGNLLGLSRVAQVAVALMAVAPGAPVALRRSIAAGSHRSAAITLQALVALLAIGMMPLSVQALNAIYGTHASIAPSIVAAQVFKAQLLPLGLGLLLRWLAPVAAQRVEPVIRRVAAVLLILFLVVTLGAIGSLVLAAAPGTGVAALIVTTIALAVGHVLGGPDEDTRRAVALMCAIRNVGLALLVASANQAPPELLSTLFAYMLWTGLFVTPYVIWRRRVHPL